MTKQSTIWGVIFVLVLVIGGVWVSKKSDTTGPVTTSGEAIKIGAILPLTGDLAFLGEEVKKGIDLALSEINKDSKQAEIIYEDDAFDPKQSVSAANKLINVDKVDAVVTMVVEEAQPIMPVFKAAQIPLLVLWDGNQAISEGGDYIFSNGFSTEKAATDAANYTYERLGAKTVAIVAHVSPWAEISTNSFKETFEKLGGKVVFSEALQVDVTDYRTVIAKVKTLAPDAIYFPQLPPHNARFLVQAKQLGLKSNLITGDGLIQDSITEAGSAAENVYFTNFYTEKLEELTVKYKSIFGSEPLDSALVSFGYDGVMKLFEAKRFGGSLKSGLDKVFGPTRSANRAEKIYQVRSGVPVEVNES